MRHLTPLFLLTALACAANSTTPPAGSTDGPLSIWDAVTADDAAQTIYARNNTQQSITVDTVTIVRCQNIQETCGNHPVNVVIAPSRTEVVFRIRRLDSHLAWSWQYHVRTARQHVAMTTMTTAPGAASVIGPDGTRSMARVIPVDSFVAAVPALSTGATCGRITIPDLPAGHQALIMIFGTASQPVARRVLVRLDANGNAYDYSDTRDGAPPGGAATMISLDLERQHGLLRNSRAVAHRRSGSL